MKFSKPVIIFIILFILGNLAIFTYGHFFPANKNFNEGINNRNLRNYEQAIEYFTKAIKIDPKYIDAYHWRGITYNDLKKYDEAINDFNNTIKLSPEHAEAYKYKGDIYFDLEKYEEAIHNYDKAIKINPKKALWYISRGMAYQTQGMAEQNPFIDNSKFNSQKKYNKAIENFTKALEINPKFAIVYKARSQAYILLGQNDKADADYKKAIELDPSLTDK